MVSSLRFMLRSGLVILAAYCGVATLAAQEETPDAPPPAVEAAKSDEHAKGGKDGHEDHGKGHAGHAHHDPSDLTEGDASAALVQPQEVRFDLSVATFILFLVLLAVLTKFAWGPISHGLETREHAIAEMIENAKKDSEKASEHLRQYEQKLTAAADEARNLIGEARKEAERAREQIVSDAKAAAQHEKDRAIADIQLAKQEALRAIAQRSVDAAIRLAGNIVKREIKPADHEQLITQALKELPSVN